MMRLSCAPAFRSFSAAVLGSRIDGGQHPHRLVLATSPGGGEDVAQLADGRLEQHGRQFDVFMDVSAGADRGSGPAVDQLHRRHRKYVAGHHPSGDGARDRLRRTGI